MKLKINYLYILGFLLILQSCGGSADASKVSKTKLLVDSMQFEIQHEWANPIIGGRINLIGNPNYIRFNKDSVDLFLPYFGERYSGGGYNSEGGIVYKGLIEDLDVNTEDKNTQIKFSADKGTESLNFMITVYSEGSADTRVTSSDRSFISYQGQIDELKNEKEE
ncbi:uncharacterized protein DUF4251 [Salegentibacter sp. 24]|uniref:DUF4251 domain-containing protein n=1 Tax=Salegentibacter sp. 24 TaxID=2183986 RepID=UPI00105E83EB|nr:DUF4251 domain-containing protein [Salegentibacter sp. 24]TDN89353.1 uncharacterized protein DUF4251 [Salegentibacter sp. 24]